ncbi:amidohydrolase [Cesiribacter andamanensis]|uniref:N-substituted formamide deformylase n=1 Tax=Cesiribacter andamanensis AMV16 TaxID=1279009 RepID=M7P1J9_9BACT|nr:amidohydrolase [Cesiribacter andamanensis]EMR04489.1 N-substituted formamide deformylase precursor [Cesiribacter andamanensis AMV16]
MKKRFFSLPILAAALLAGCTSLPESEQQTQAVDYILTNGRIYTVDSSFTVHQAMAVREGRIVATGSSDDIQKRFTSDSLVNLQGKAVYPGFIDAHCHFYRYGLGLQTADLVGASSWQEVLQRLQEQRRQFPQADWLLGRGWDQNDWPVKEFPTRAELDRLFPDIPVFITRVDGHAAIANGRALQLAGITAASRIEGGKIGLEGGQPSGLLIDNAVDLVSSKIPEPDRQEQIAALRQAERNVFAVGLTSVADAGLDRSTIHLIDSLQEEGALQIRVYAMLNPTEENMLHYFESGPLKKERLTVTSFKIYSDGALGSRGALLLAPYSDDQDNHGLLLSQPFYFADMAKKLHANGFQMNTHCIGDSANRLVLDTYAQVLGEDNDRRWRIEHSQVVTKEDLQKYQRYRVIPSIQPTHATSDMYWAADRLGQQRVKTAYAYQDLLKQTGVVALGSDFPVEDINPLWGFYAAIARQDEKSWPEGGFQPENKLSREQALRGMTIWAAYANFEEEEKGSLEAGKWADFVVLEKDIMEVAERETRDARVLHTVVAGKKVN